MKKRYHITAIIFGILGIVYGAFCNYLVRDEKSIFLSIMSGFFVGILFTAMYYLLTFFLGYQYGDTTKESEKYIKMLVRIQNLIVFNALIFGCSILIASGDPITLTYFWIHLINIAISLLIIVISNLDGKRIRRTRLKAISRIPKKPHKMLELLSNEQIAHLISTAPTLDLADQIVESLSGSSYAKDKCCFLQKTFEDASFNSSLQTDEEIYLDLLKQKIQSSNTNKTP